MLPGETSVRRSRVIVSPASRSAAPRVTRDEIVDAAIRVIDREGPRPSMDGIAREAGITKPRLYRQFADKADLYTEIANRMSRNAFAATGEDMTLMLQPPRPALRRVFGAYAQGILEHPNVFRFLAQAPVASSGEPAGSVLQFDLGRDAARRFTKLARAIAEAVPIDDGGIDYLARAVVGVVVAVTDLWLESAPERSADEFVGQATELVWGLIDGFLRRQGIAADPESPIFTTLAEVNQGRDAP
ncbi:TetR/AcrR family transcriptional regulator [Nocardia terpenica]|nr:TetR/AcrR family transcriptional regulator [Nocardia terpenica]MBF6103016.1 TetR/AcrR family transcriptional regulator [Nocardia terpenica]MBF6110795.1 TetR/AcrR family transcriptional regulator [Nocardia terpenica]MBF6116926.1 TetR/AcrR family transcriptional regulator [Nocardia terpenica]MBF6151236.1 TetR/AcrR family transcriptional regulator [Nocardia terpenica]